MGQNVLSQSDCSIFWSIISPEQINEIDLFFSCLYKFTKIKNWSKNVKVDMAKNQCSQSGHGTLKLTVFQEWTDRMNWLFNHGTNQES